MIVRNDKEGPRIFEEGLQKNIFCIIVCLFVCLQKKLQASPLLNETWGQVALRPPKPMKRMTMMVARMMRTKMRMVTQDLCLSHQDLSASSMLSPPIRPTRASSSFCRWWSWSWWCWCWWWLPWDLTRIWTLIPMKLNPSLLLLLLSSLVPWSSWSWSPAPLSSWSWWSP